MKKVLLLVVFWVSFFAFASEAPYKALFLKDTNLLFKVNALAWEEFKNQNKLDEMLAKLGGASRFSGISESMLKELEEKLKAYKPLNYYATMALQKDFLLGKVKQGKGVFFLLEVEQAVSPELLMEIAGLIAQKEPFEFKRADKGEYPAIELNIKGEAFVVLLLDGGKSIVMCQTAELDDYIARYKKGNGETPAKLTELETVGGEAKLSIAFAMPEGMGKYLADKAEKARENDPMNATFMDTGAKLNGISLTVNPLQSKLDVKIGFLMETPEDAIQLKAFIFEGVLRPMFSLMTDSQGMPYAFVKNLAFSCENRCALAKTFITVGEIEQLFKMVTIMNP